jgi:hypothetical protein
MKGNRNEKKQKGNRGEWRDTALTIFCRKLSYWGVTKLPSKLELSYLHYILIY